MERKADTTIVSEHTMEYDLNGNLTRDVTRNQNADNHSAYVTTTSVNTYDPRDRIAQVTRTGAGAGTESYIHDANNNVISSTTGGVTTAHNYDRNRLRTSTTAGITSSHNYDPFGRLDTVTLGGVVIERNIYDGFDHITENRKTGAGTTKYTFDALDRTTSKTTDAGTAKQKTTRFSYLGMSGEVLDEQVGGQTTKSYQFSPWGERLSQVTHNSDGSKEDAFYGYNAHTDVEQLTDDSGNTKATYGYTAYGKNDEARFTGADKPDTADPTKEPYNAYRFNSKRWDQNTGNYDMGFRDYSPGLNRFLARDSYNGALNDMKLGMDPFTGNRYAFAGGNPITRVELDGHRVLEDDTEIWQECSSMKECERQAEDKSLIPPWDPPDVGGGEFEQYIPYVLEMAAKTGLDPKLLLANLITEMHRCTEVAGNSMCRFVQNVQKNATNPWWSVVSPLIPIIADWAGQGDDASIGISNFDKKTFEETKAGTAPRTRQPQLG